MASPLAEDTERDAEAAAAADRGQHLYKSRAIGVIDDPKPPAEICRSGNRDDWELVVVVVVVVGGGGVVAVVFLVDD